MRDNYAIQLAGAERGFLRYNTEEIADRFSLRRDASAIYVTFLAQELRIDRETARITHVSDGSPAGFNAGMTVFDILTNPNGLPALTGRWCAHGHFNAVQSGTLSGRLGVSDSLAAPFAGKRDLLRAACKALGAQPEESGDYACVLPLFPFFPVLLRFWEADEEFPAKLDLLWDERTTRYLRYETTFYTTAAVFDRLYALAGLPVGKQRVV